VQKLLSGQLPDRPPIHDLILNDQILEHFGGRKITRENAEEVVLKPYRKSLILPGPIIFCPRKKGWKPWMTEGR
jgi:hypothetical protein